MHKNKKTIVCSKNFNDPKMKCCIIFVKRGLCKTLCFSSEMNFTGENN